MPLVIILAMVSCIKRELFVDSSRVNAMRCCHHIFAICGTSSLGILIAFVATIGNAAPAKPPFRIAILAMSGQEGLADILTAELSKQRDVALVEREAINRVINEITFAAAQRSDGDAALKLGELLAADAMLFVGPEPNAEPPQVRLRLVETKTSIRLGDWSMPAGGLQADAMEEVMTYLRPALTKLGVPPGDRHLVGVVGIRPEVANTELATVARGLTVLFERDLEAFPGVVVLDREQLRGLTAEKVLTGIEMDLKASAWLIEGGIRRDGDRFAVTLKLVPMAGGVSRVAEFTSAADLGVLRRAAAETIAGLFQADLKTFPAPVDPAAESAQLAARSEQSRVLFEAADAIRFAEAAYALAPNERTFRTACHAYSHHEFCVQSGLSMWRDQPDWTRHWFNRDLYPTAEAARVARLETLVRWAELVRDYYERCARDRRLEAAFPIWDPTLLFWRRGRPESDAERRLAAEHSSIEEATYQRILTTRRAFGGSGATAVILRRLDAIAMLVWGTGSYSAEALTAFLREIEHELAVEEAAGRLPTDRAVFEARYHDLLWQAVNEYKHPPPPVTDIRPLLESFVESKVAAIRLVGWSRLLELPGDAGADAAERFLETLFSGELRRGPWKLDNSTSFERTAYKAALRLAKAGRLAPVVDRLFAKAEADRDIAPLLEWHHALSGLMVADRDRAAALAARVDALLADRAYAARAEPAAAFYKRQQEILRPKPPPTIGPLAKFDVREIRITNPEPGFGHLAMVHVDRTPDGDPRRPLVLVWSKHRPRPSRQPNDPPEFEYLVARVGTDGGEMKVESRCRLPIHVIFDMASAGEHHFFGTEQHGLAIVTPRGTTMMASHEGLPTGHIGPMAWLDGRLYTAVPDGLAVVNPDARTCAVVSSGRSMKSRNPLDSVGAYAMPGVVADSPRGRLVMLVTSMEPDEKVSPGGLWSYTPKIGEWKRLAPRGCFGLVCGEAEVFYGRRDSEHEVPYRLNLVTSEITPLRGYAYYALPHVSQRNPAWTIFDDVLFSSRDARARNGFGGIYAWPPGTKCRGSAIHRVGDEVVVFDDQSGRLSVIRRKETKAAP